MARADSYIAGLFPTNVNKTAVRSRRLTSVEAFTLSTGLRADAADFYYSAWVSFLDALRGIGKGFYTWATVKLYYSVFYTFRASLANCDICEFHVESSHYIVTANAGALPVSCSDRGTHKTILKSFQRQNPGHLLVSQQIDLEDAVDWLIHLRESANYGEARFGEPDYGRHFDYVAQNGLRNSLNGYLDEPSPLYVFDPDHAIVAYPLRALQMIGNQIVANSPLVLSQEEQRFLRTCARDDGGPLSMLIGQMRQLQLLA